MMDVNMLLDKAILETAQLMENEIFLVKDLFKGYEWNRIPRSDRLLLGTLFLNYVNKTNGHIQAAQKTASGQQKYIVGKTA
ncbi:MAG: single-stranded DNA-binding protein [Eubacteriales bacterium]|nr:single-stranded DNA-binding protein [Eubacteriales bacterium]